MSFQPLKPDDVITLAKERVMANFPTTARHEEIVELMKNRLFSGCACKDEWFTKGVDCRMLRENGGWVEGRIRIQLQFDPDPEPSDEAPEAEAPTP